MKSRKRFVVVFSFTVVFGCMLGLSNLFALAPEEGLVAEWTFEEGKGDSVKDTSGNNNNGILHNGPTWVEDGIGNALKFDGVDDYVDCGATDTLDIKKQISMEAWIYPIEPTSGVGEPLIVGKGISPYGLAYNPGTIWFYIGPHGGWNCVSEIPTKKWTHVVGTYDGKGMKLYINGEFRTGYIMPNPDTPIEGSGNSVLIGKRGEKTAGAYFYGMVDNVRIYNRPLSEKEVESHYIEEKKLVKQPLPVSRENLKGLALKVYDIGDEQKLLLVRGPEVVDSDLTVPANVHLKFEIGGVCEIREGATLTINGPVEAPLAQIFSGKGKVIFGRGYVERVYPQWWGARTDDSGDDIAAIQSAIDSHPTGGVVFFHSGRYEISSRLVIYSGSILEGALSGAQLHAAKVLPAMLQRPNLTPPPDGIHYNAATRIDNVRIANLYFKGEGSVVGLDLTNVNYVWLENVSVTDCQTGIMMAQLGMYETFINPVVSRCDTGIEFNIGTMDSNIFGGRIAAVKTGILINNTGQLNIYGITFDAYTGTAFDIRTGDSVNLMHPWFDSVEGTVPAKIGPSVSSCTIVNPRFSGPTPKVIDNKSQTTVISDN